MAPLAIYLSQMGERVFGFDDCLSGETALLLLRGGVEVVRRPEKVPPCDVFIHTAALRREDPLLREAADRRGLAVFSRGTYLASILKNNRLLAVVGSHGKTTTTAHLIAALEERNFPFNYLLGGRFVGKKLPARYSAAEWTVAEIDESEPSIELFSPDITLALNLSLDHDAHYGSLGALRETFHRLFARTKKCVLAAENEKSLAPFRVRENVRLYPEFPCEDRSVAPFNRSNRAAAAAAAELLCPAGTESVPAVAVQRRQTRIFSDRWELIGDYAHHPREIEEFLHFHWGPATVLLFQPHRFSRTASHREEFLAILARHSPALLMPTYGAFEEPDRSGYAERLSEDLAAEGIVAPCLEGKELVARLDDLRRHSNFRRFLFVGAGPIGAFAESYGRRLRCECFWEKCRALLPHCALAENVPMARLTSLRIGGPARFLAEPNSLEELRLLLRCAREADLRSFVLGSGSNLLVDDGGFFGLVLRPCGAVWQRCRIGPEHINVRCGLPLRRLARLCEESAIGGYEFCDGIPGTVGGAILQNAGAFGSAIGDGVEEVTVLQKDGKLARLQPTFSYRSSSLPREAIVLSARLRRPAGGGGFVPGRRDEMAKVRREKQPQGSSAGCLFRNPPSHSAGELIERAGLKGFRSGGMEISQKHGNFAINRGGASAADVLNLTFFVKRAVRERFKIDLVTEVYYLADFWEGPL